MWLCGNGMLLAWFLAARSRPGESGFCWKLDSKKNAHCSEESSERLEGFEGEVETACSWEGGVREKTSRRRIEEMQINTPCPRALSGDMTMISSH